MTNIEIAFIVVSLCIVFESATNQYTINKFRSRIESLEEQVKQLNSKIKGYEE